MVRLPVEGFWLPVGGASLFALIDTILSIAVGGFATFGDTIVRSGLVFTFVTTACYMRHLAGDPQIRTAVFSALSLGFGGHFSSCSVAACARAPRCDEQTARRTSVYSAGIARFCSSHQNPVSPQQFSC